MLRGCSSPASCSNSSSSTISATDIRTSFQSTKALRAYFRTPRTVAAAAATFLAEFLPWPLLQKLPYALPTQTDHSDNLAGTRAPRHIRSSAVAFACRTGTRNPSPSPALPSSLRFSPASLPSPCTTLLKHAASRERIPPSRVCPRQFLRGSEIHPVRRSSARSCPLPIA